MQVLSFYGYRGFSGKANFEDQLEIQVKRTEPLQTLPL
jgi:hypothetical protein